MEKSLLVGETEADWDVFKYLVIAAKVHLGYFLMYQNNEIVTNNAINEPTGLTFAFHQECSTKDKLERSQPTGSDLTSLQVYKVCHPGIQESAYRSLMLLGTGSGHQ